MYLMTNYLLLQRIWSGSGEVPVLVAGPIPHQGRLPLSQVCLARVADHGTGRFIRMVSREGGGRGWKKSKCTLYTIFFCNVFQRGID